MSQAQRPESLLDGPVELEIALINLLSSGADNIVAVFQCILTVAEDGAYKLTSDNLKRLGSVKTAIQAFQNNQDAPDM